MAKATGPAAGRAASRGCLRPAPNPNPLDPPPPPPPLPGFHPHVSLAQGSGLGAFGLGLPSWCRIATMAPPPSAAAAAAHHHAASPPVFLARSPYHPRRAAAAASCSLVRSAFLSCPPDHRITAAPPPPPPRATPSSSPSSSSSSSSPAALVAPLQDLYDFICGGPLVGRIGYSDEKVAETIDRWLLAGAHVARLCGLNELQLSGAEKARVYHYYIPVFLWCQDQVAEHRAKYGDGDEVPPLVIGVSAPQGSGKTTLVFALDYLFRVDGRKSVTLSIDDFYLTAKEQKELRDRNPGNSLLELRGNAGSHDLQFSVETLESLVKLTKEGMKMKVPRYDKSAFGGRGDRADPSVWPEVEGPLEVILFEGWMLGFKPLPNEVVKKVDPQLEVVNKNLEAYYDAWDRFIQSWIVIKIKDPSCVYQWRLQAEVAMRADGKPGMSDEEVMDFVSRYLAAYHAYLPTLYKEGPNGSDPNHLLVIDIDENRSPICG